MDALDIISLEDAKKELVMTGISDRDAEIESIIKSAIAWVEKYTDYRLYNRDEIINAVFCKNNLTQYPISITSVKNSDDEDVTYTQKNGVLSLIIDCPEQSVITANVGYTENEVDDIPQPLIRAAYKLITYLFENKDAYTVGLPLDIQLLLNQYRRSATI
jgi:hypothetical protein